MMNYQYLTLVCTLIYRSDKTMLRACVILSFHAFLGISSAVLLRQREHKVGGGLIFKENTQRVRASVWAGNVSNTDNCTVNTKPPGTPYKCSETATASGGQGNNEINMTCTKPKCSIRDMIKQVEELIGIDETESQGNITIQQLVGFADDILGRREACKDSIRPACTSSSAISISSYCSQGSYEFEGPDPLESLGFDQSTLDKIQKLEVEHLKQICSNTDELTQQLEAALEKYKAWRIGEDNVWRYKKYLGTE